MGQNLTNEEYCRESATKKFERDRGRLSKVRKIKRGPQDPLGKNYSYLPWVPTKTDVAPPVPYIFNPLVYRPDREYSNKPPYLQVYERRPVRRKPNLFNHDPNYSTTTYVPPDHRLCKIDPERQPIDMDALFKYRNRFKATENPYGELTSPLNIPQPIHENPDPYKVHLLDERGFFRPRKK